jgi:hypothetical protein
MNPALRLDHAITGTLRHKMPANRGGRVEAYIPLRPERPLGDTLQGMRRQGKVHIRGQGKDVQYFVA